MAAPTLQARAHSGPSYTTLLDDSEDEPSQPPFNVYERTRAHADATIEDLPLTAPGLVPWREPSEVTLHEMLVHMIVKTERHLGQADILRESIDSSVGYYPANDHPPAMDQDPRHRLPRPAGTGR